MKNLKHILLSFVMLLTSTISFAQKDTIALQREARKYLREGNELYNQKNYTDAFATYKKALEKNSSYKKAIYNMGSTLYQNNLHKDAAEQYNLALEGAKDKFEKAETYHNIGNAMMKQKQYQPAIDAYKNSLRSNPNDDETRYNLAVAQKLLEKEKNKNKDKDKNNKDNNKDKKERDDKNDKDEKKDSKKDGDKGDKNEKKQNPNKDDKKEQKKKPQQGKMTPEQIKQLLESLNNEEKKTQKKLNAKKAKGKKVKQEKDW